MLRAIRHILKVDDFVKRSVTLHILLLSLVLPTPSSAMFGALERLNPARRSTERSDGYLASYGPVPLRYRSKEVQADRRSLILSPPAAASPVVEQNVSDVAEADMDPMLVAVSVEPSPESAAMPKKSEAVQKSVEPSKKNEAYEPVYAGPEKPVRKTGYINLEDILVYFEKETHDEEGGERVGIPFLFPRQSLTARPATPSRAVYERK